MEACGNQIKKSTGRQLPVKPVKYLAATHNPGGTAVYVEKLPKCDFCSQPALYDAKTTMGSWAHMCQDHYLKHGIGLGTGKGQKLIPRKALGEAEKIRGEPSKELTVRMTPKDLEAATLEDIWYPVCPYCGAETPAEPDAHAVYCEACSRRFKIINPFFSSTTEQYSTTSHERKYWARINDPGDSSFVEDALIPYEEFEAEREKILQRGGRPPSLKIKVEVPPGNGNGSKQLPQTIEGEPVPDKYKWLIPFIGDEPLPPEADILLPAIEVAEGERKIDAVLRRLAGSVESIQESIQFRLFLTTMSKFHKYSVSNLMLIAIQKPGATHVAGFVTWKDLGRWVKGGESGIAILAPIMPPKLKKEEIEEEEEVELTPVYFKVVHVFDISQTDGKPLPEFDVPVLTGEANEELWTKVLALAKAQGLEVSFESRPLQDPSIKGQYFGKSIWVRPEEPRAQQLKSLLHELAHYYSEGVFRIPRRDAETIAESAAFVVGAHHGFDSGVRSFPYVALWAQDKKILQQNLSSIRKVATVILESVEKPQGVKAEAAGEKLVPALKPFEPYKFAEYVLRANVFSEWEIPLYSGLTGTKPLRVPDHIWSEVLEAIDGEFVKMGELYVVKTKGVERPTDMRAAPTWRDIASTQPSPPNPKEEKEFVSDSPEFVAYTIEDIGYREKLDTAFETAIAKAKGA